MPEAPDTELGRRDAVRAILARRGDALVIGGLGSPAWDCAAVENNPLDFLLWGAMGSAAAISLGLACAQPRRRVLVITGDGDMTMALGTLAAIAGARPRHLDLAGVAEKCGFADTRTVRDQAGLEAALPIIHHAPGPIAVIVKVKAEDLPRVLPPRDGAYLKDRFRTALLEE